MAAEDILFINGAAHSHASCKIYLAGDPVPYTGVKAVNYSHKLEPGEFRGTNLAITRRTAGEYSCDGDIEMRIDEADRLITNLGDGWMMIPIRVTVTRVEAGMTTIVDELYGVRLTESGTSSSEGKDATTRKFKMHPILIVENGILPFPGAIIPELDEVA